MVNQVTKDLLQDLSDLRVLADRQRVVLDVIFVDAALLYKKLDGDTDRQLKLQRLIDITVHKIQGELLDCVSMMNFYMPREKEDKNVG